VIATQPALDRLVEAIAEGDAVTAIRMLSAAPELASCPVAVGATRSCPDYFLPSISHHVYAGDTALHIAGAAYQVLIARDLLAAGADVDARNRRGATALHYAAEGTPGSAYWDPPAQAAMITYLVESGADPNAVDRSGVAPLHRAVRTRCGAAVIALLDAGADPQLANRAGSTPLKLATRATGRGGSSSAAARAQQDQIVRELRFRGALI
jgi:hypothetical protein